MLLRLLTKFLIPGAFAFMTLDENSRACVTLAAGGQCAHLSSFSGNSEMEQAWIKKQRQMPVAHWPNFYTFGIHIIKMALRTNW